MSTTRPRTLALVLAGLLVARAAPAQTVHVVEPGDILNLKIQAAADGDILLVKDGFYDTGPFWIIGKGLTLVGEGSATLDLSFIQQDQVALNISGLSNSQSVVVRGFTVTTQHFESRTAVLVWGCEGPVLIEECVLKPRNGIGLDVLDSTSVTVRDCELSGGFDEFPVAGLRVDSSQVQLYQTDVHGGDGGPAQQSLPFLPLTVNGHGGDGAILLGSSIVHATDVTFLGGDGGDPGSFCLPGGDAGHGLVLGSGSDSPVLRTRDTSYAAGTPTAGGCALPAGTPGIPIVQASGLIRPQAGAGRALSMNSPVLSGQNVTISLDGEPGDIALLLYAANFAEGTPVLGGSSVLHLTAASVLPLGPLPTGDLDLVFALPLLPPGVQGVTLAVQAGFANGAHKQLSGPSVGVFLAP